MDSGPPISRRRPRRHPPRIPGRWPGPVAALLLCLSTALTLAAESVPDTEQALQELQQRLEQSRGQLDQRAALRDRLVQELHGADQALHQALAALRKLAAEQETLAAEVIALEERAHDADRRVAAERAQLAGYLRAAHRLGLRDRLRLLLSQQDPAGLGRTLAYYRWFTRSRAQHIAALRQAQSDLAAIRERHGEQARLLDAATTRSRQQHQQLEAQRARRAAVLKTVEQELEQDHDRLAGLEQDQAELQGLLEQLHAALIDIPPQPPGTAPFASLMGTLPRPAPGRIAVAFGHRPRPHAPPLDGVLLKVANDTEVRAVAAGRIAYADWLRGQRLLVAIDHGDGYLSLYGNNDALLREVGEWVTAGDAVALAGGSSYFGLRRAGRARDPAGWWQ